jgi:hypothetical protein
MKRLMLAALVCAGCSQVEQNCPPEAKPTVQKSLPARVVTIDDNLKEVEIAAGQDLIVKLVGDRDKGEFWEVGSYDNLQLGSAFANGPVFMPERQQHASLPVLDGSLAPCRQGAGNLSVEFHLSPQAAPPRSKTAFRGSV